MGKVGLATRGIPQLIDPLPGGSHLIDGIEFIVSWARANSLWPLVYGTACCAMEMMSAGASKHDWARFGVEVARATPRQADLIVLAGTIVEKMGERLVTLYKQMPGPKYVIAMGACSISGGPFYYDSYSVIRGGDRLIPVDIYIPGCPPRPEALLHGIMELQKKIRTEGRRNPWRVAEINADPAIDEFSAARTLWKLEHGDSKQQTLTSNEVAQPPKPVRRAKENFPEIAKLPTATKGLSPADIQAIILKEFPEAICPGSGTEQEPGKVLNTCNDSVWEIPADHYLPFVEFLKTHAILQTDLLLMLTAVDWLDHFEVVLQLLATKAGHKIRVRTQVSRVEAELPSITSLFATAEWHEREVFDLLGIRFTNHPDLRRLFLEDDFPGHPLRKDFVDSTRVIKRPY